MSTYPQIIQEVLTRDQAEDGDQQREPVLAFDFKDISIMLIPSEDADFTVKVAGSDQKSTELPTVFSYLQTKNKESSSYIDGDTGIAVTGGDPIELEVNADIVGWLKIEISDYNAGSLTATAVLKTN